MSPARERGLGFPRDSAFTIAVFVTALLPRLFVAIAWAKEPVWDGHYYHFGAERIARGLGYSEDVIVRGLTLWKPWVHYPVGYSALLGLFYRIFGAELVVAPVVNALTGALLAAVVHRVARYYLSRDRARVAAGLTALHPGLIAYSAAVMTEPLAALLMLGATLAALHFRGRWHAVLYAGVLLGLATLVRPSSLAAAPLLILTQPRPLVQAGLRALAISVVSLLVVLPWTARNCARLDGCALVSTNGGWNLAIGAITETGRFQTLHGSDGCPIVTGQVQQDRCWGEVGRAKIAADPGHWLGLAPLKLSQTFDHESFAIEYLHEADPDSWPEPRRVAARELLTAFHRALLVLAALSVIAWPRWDAARRPAFFTQLALGALLVGIGAYASLGDTHPFYVLAVLAPLIAAFPMIPGAPEQGPTGYYLLALLAATALTHVVFFGEDRYHLVVSPMLCILAAAALRVQATVTGPSVSANSR
ncbi:MAG: glycosyltransferase family 39 protein [Myxococcales bacterium]